MPTIRYEIRNEYGLADPELHRAADKDDPEAILEGVAMSGFAGVLRQLGDLAEFAAEIFHDLHEEVMGTAVRGHGLMLQVQQLEADFPAVEKAIFSQSSHSGFSYSNGIDWHSNFHLDQNIITQGDMSRFILDSYEECRGPPRLFILDKFDTAGAGACLKRYSDPSFFKTELVSSSLMEAEKPREKKPRRTRTDKTLEFLLSPRANTDSKPASSVQVADKSATRFVRLKSRNLDDTNESKLSGLRKHLLQLHLDEQKIAFDSSQSSSNLNSNLIDSSVPTSLTRDTAMNMSENHSLVGDSCPTMNSKEESTRITAYELDGQKAEAKELSESVHRPIVGVPYTQRGYNLVDSRENSADSDIKSESSAYDNELSDIVRSTSQRVADHKLVRAELQLEGSTDGYRTEDIGSEQENFMDTPNSMESEVETHLINKGVPDIGALKKEGQEIDTYNSERVEEMLTQISEPDYTGPVRSNIMLISGMTNHTSNLDEVFTNQEAEDTQEPTLPHGEVANSADLVSDEASNMETFDDPTTLQPKEIINENWDSYDTCPVSDFININPEESSAPCLIPGNKSTSASNDAQLESDEIAKCFNGPPYQDPCLFERTRPEDHVDEDIHIVDQLSCPLTRSTLVEDLESEDSFSMTTIEEIQVPVDQEIKIFASKDAANSSIRRSILPVASDFVPDIYKDALHCGELLADVDDFHHPEELLSDASICVEGTDDLAQYHSTENSIIGCDSVLLISEEAKSSLVLSDEISKTKQENVVLKDSLPYDEVLLQTSTTNIGNSPETVNQHAETCPTQNISPLAHVISTISIADCATEIQSVLAIENIKVSIENGDGIESNFSMPTILQPQFDYFSGTEEPLESPKMNLGEEFQKSFEGNNEEKTPLCSSREIFSESVSNSIMLDDNLKFSKNFYLDRLQDAVGMPEQRTVHKNLTDETFASNDEANNKEPYLVHTEEALDQHLQLLEDSNDLASFYEHQPINHEMHPLNTVESLSSQSTLNMEDSPGLDPTASCSGLPVNNSSNANDTWLLGDIHETMPGGHVKAYPVLDDPYLNYRAQSEHSDSKCIAQGEHESVQGDMPLPTNSIFDFVSLSEEISAIPTGNGDVSTLQASEGGVSTVQISNGDVSSSQTSKEIASASQASNEVISSLQISDQEFYYLQDRKELYEANNFDVSTLQASNEEISTPQTSKEVVSIFQASNEEVSPLQVCNAEFSNSQARNAHYSTLEASNKESGSLHQKGECLELEIPIHYIELEDKPSEGPEPNFHALTNNVLLHMPASNSDENAKMDSQAHVSSEWNSEISAHHATYDISDMAFYPLSGSDVSAFESTSRISHQSQEGNSNSSFPSQNHEETPPSPPLPPLEWRSQKLSSLLPNQNPILALPRGDFFMSSSDSTPENPYLCYSNDRHLYLENEVVQSQSPFLVETSNLDDNHHILSLSSGLDMPQHGYVYSLERIQPTLFAFVPTKEGEMFGINPRSIRNRPRNPLIDAVVAHDRSKLRKVLEVARPSDEYKADQMDALLESNILQLRKVSELARPSDKPKSEEKDALLEQIRNKSYSLKPATVLWKPSHKSDSRNIRVVAILEKANAVRQAMVGSDEDDCEDNWSDC
ncbi:scar-like domain-containing protein WAVE 5 isoform X2 [Zingiber officinale]|uniref:scar-like domain-containing protein WAVE 5 isoform X2 n=1 Tax=Zingiber officinale TaxID=94328 RepID=UPI001C4B14F9|nr:scar-like domain-containing protein WAVE 5 isoform X2 [Zingiber officinale]